MLKPARVNPVARLGARVNCRSARGSRLAKLFVSVAFPRGRGGLPARSAGPANTLRTGSIDDTLSRLATADTE